ncbi:MAG: GIDE domain-containing protein [Terriglobales bacterium]
MNVPAFILPSGELAIFTIIGIAGGLYLFLRGFRLLARKRLLLNTPTSKIRSASLGLVEVGGLATGPYTMPAPLTGKACYLYQTTVWQQRDSGKNQEWEKVAEESLHVPFFLDDNTGQLLIAPEGAELDLHRDFREEYSSSFFSTLDAVPPQVTALLARHGVEPSRTIRVEERCIKPKNALFIVGTLAENPGLEVRPFPAALRDAYDSALTPGGLHRRPVSTPPSEVVRLSEPADPSAPGKLTQQSKIAAALAKAGITNPAAWAAAGVPYRTVTVEETPRVSQISVSGKGQPDKPDERSAFDLTPPVVLMKGENNPAFLISWRSQHDLVRSLAWKSAAMIWGGAALTLLGIYVLLAQLELV